MAGAIFHSAPNGGLSKPARTAALLLAGVFLVFRCVQGRIAHYVQYALLCVHDESIALALLVLLC